MDSLIDIKMLLVRQQRLLDIFYHEILEQRNPNDAEREVLSNIMTHLKDDYERIMRG